MSYKVKHGLAVLGITLAAAMTLSGCTPGKKEETEAVTEAQTTSETTAVLYIPEETETETQTVTEVVTEAPTEPQTQPQITLSDITSQVLPSDYSGNGEYEIMGNEVKSGTVSYQANSTAFYATFSDDSLVYAGEDKTIARNADGWTDVYDDFTDIWDLIHDSDCELMPQGVMIDGTGCYHITLTFYDDISPISGMITALGKENVILGPVDFSFYVTADTYEIVRVDMIADYQTTDGEKNVTEEFTCSITCSSISGVELKAPETEATVVDTYTPGNIDIDKNLYYNDYFDIQIAGKDMVDFDINQTRELDTGYQESNSSYTEEGYASGNGTLVNISSLSAQKMSINDVLDKYLADSSATNVEVDGTMSIGENTYSCAWATINNTQTKTYCTITDNKALIITLYYNDEAMIPLFESHMYALDQDAAWEEDSWTLQSRYTIYTPNGFVVSDDIENSDLYVCMKSNDQEVNIFALENSSLDTVADDESTSTETITREVITSNDTNVEDGSILRYLVVHNVDTSDEENVLDYYTYIGLIQKDTAVIEFYVVSTHDDLDYESTYVDFSNNISVSEYVEETLPEETLIEEEVSDDYNAEEYVDDGSDMDSTTPA